jgi:hypothetical protein
MSVQRLQVIAARVKNRKAGINQQQFVQFYSMIWESTMTYGVFTPKTCGCPGSVRRKNGLRWGMWGMAARLGSECQSLILSLFENFFSNSLDFFVFLE